MVERELDPDPDRDRWTIPGASTPTSEARRWWRRRELNPRPKTSLREILQV